VRGPEGPAPGAAPLLQALAAIDPDTLSPREALQALYRLKQLAAPTETSTEAPAP
jgi:DNA mismatch repair protein MutS